jgi:Domain of unknown function (DUF4158)
VGRIVWDGSRWLVALVDRTAYPRLPRAVAARELAEVFTPTTDEVAWARAKTTTDQHCLSLLVLLKCYQRVGYFPRLEQVPAAVTEHVRDRAALLSAELVCDDSALRVKRYRGFIREWVGAVWEPRRARTVTEAAMPEALLSKDNPADVINVALEQLTQQRCELPAYSMLDRLAARVRTEVNGGFHRLVAGRLDAAARARLFGAVDRGSAAPAQSAGGVDSTGAEGDGDPVEEAFGVFALAG